MLYFIFLILCILLVYLGFYTCKYSNPYKLIMIFGKKGSGKTTTLCYLAQKHLRKGWTVYSTVPIPGCFTISPDDVGFKQFPERSLLLIDEVGMIWDNRNYKQFKSEVRDFFKLQRHYKCKVYLFSQTFDVDVKLRNLTDSMYMMVNVFGVLSYGKQIKRKLVVVAPEGDSESRIADKLVISPFFLAPFGARMFVWIPSYARLFDSFEAPVLADLDCDSLVDYPDDVPIGFRAIWLDRFSRLCRPVVLLYSRLRRTSQGLAAVADGVPTPEHKEPQDDSVPLT